MTSLSSSVVVMADSVMASTHLHIGRHLSKGKEDRFSRVVVGGISHSQSMCQAEIRSKLRETISPSQSTRDILDRDFFSLFSFLDSWNYMGRRWLDIR